MPDERKGLPSVSSRERNSLCAGSQNLINGLIAAGAELPDSNKPWTESGSKIHAVVEGDDVELDHAETVTAEEVKRRLDGIREALQVPDDALEIREKRIWLLRDDIRIASGKPDIVWIYGNTAVIPEVKTGWGKVASEEVNLQLRGQAVLVWMEFERVERVIVALALGHGRKPMPVVYESEDLARAHEEWLAEIDASNKPDAPRVPGEIQCKYCPGRYHCEVAHGKVLALPASIGIAPASTKQEVAAKVARMTNQQLTQTLDAESLAKIIFAALKEEAERRIGAGEIDGLGYHLGPGKKSSPITNLGLVFNRCHDKGISAEKFTAAATMSKKALTELLGATTGLKGKALDAVIEQILKGATTEKRGEPTLKRIALPSSQKL